MSKMIKKIAIPTKYWVILDTFLNFGHFLWYILLYETEEEIQTRCNCKEEVLFL